MTERCGLDLSEAFFHEVIEPFVASVAPGLRYAAALVGPGSEVLGYDDAISQDHDWAPRAMLFLDPRDEAAIGPTLRLALDHSLPETFAGHHVRIDHADPGAGQPVDHPVAGHRVMVTTLPAWLNGQLGWSDLAWPKVSDWLATPQQRLLEITAGRLFRDDDADFTALRESLAWYPDDVWRYLLACHWQRVAQLEPFVGRTGDVGDNFGSRLIAATLVRDAMRLAFLIGRRYAPYAKWFGTAFRALPLAASLADVLDEVLRAGRWREREAALVSAFEMLGHATNDLGLASLVDPSRRRFHDRPYWVIEAHRFRVSLDHRITDPAVRETIDRIGWVGAVDQFSDSVDLLASPERIAAVVRVASSGPGGSD